MFKIVVTEVNGQTVTEVGSVEIKRYEQTVEELDSMKTCITCKHYIGPRAPVECGAPGNFREMPDFVNGGMKRPWIFMRAENSREAQTTGCGTEGKWWEPLVETAARAGSWRDNMALGWREDYTHL